MLTMLERKAKVIKAFRNIGKTNGTAPPDGETSNTIGVAYELFIAKELKSHAESRYNLAKAMAEEAGVIDYDKCVEGADIKTWEGNAFDISLKQSAASTTLDKTQLKSEMAKAGISKDKADAIIAAASKPRKGAVNINISFKE